MKTIITTTFLIILNFIIYGQITNDGAMFFVQNGGIVYSEGDIENKNLGTFDNSGDIYLEGNWINNGGNTALINSSVGRVTMTGGNQQISGTDLTRFYNLRLDGGATQKEMLVNAETENELDLMSAELQTNNHTIFVTNSNTGAIVWTSGYVSSRDLGGYLSRTTNSTNAYIYPVGDNSLPNTYRAVELTPTAANNNSYAVRLAAVDATYDNSGISASGAVGGFDRSIKNPLLDQVNNSFYHNIIRLSGSDPVNARVYYYTADGDFDIMAQWDGGTSQWEITQFVNVNSAGAADIGSPNRASSLAALNNFSSDVFALTTLNKTVIIPQFISPNGDNKNDVLIIDNINFYPNNKLLVFNRYGNLVYEKQGYNNDWDGSLNVTSGVNLIFNGNGSDPLPSGTYFYILDLKVDGLEAYKGYLQIHK
jgi:gliding motility-associated-like protein